jgi:RNA polymerase sigma-54 factor
MTPRLQQAIKLLQLNTIELSQHVEEAMLENPTLEVVPDTETSDVTELTRELRKEAEKGEADLKEQQNGDEGTIDWEAVFLQMEKGPSTPSVSGGSALNDLPPIETNLTYDVSLTEHLSDQLALLRCGDDEGRAADCIIRNLDPRGYFVGELEDVVAETGADLQSVMDALEIVQSLEPVGCGARDLCECLILQVRILYPEDDIFPEIISHHLAHLERRNHQAIARALDLDVEDVLEYHRMLQDLEPRPGRVFGGEEPRYITPDIYVQRWDGDWHVLLNEDGLPDLRVSRYYRKLFLEAKSEDREYLIDKLKGAEFLIRSINKRRKTILKVMESILGFQADFFDKGPTAIRPLVLQEVADDVGVHQSTVSRVTTNKYVHTPHGLFELKYFFSSAVRQTSGLDMAAEAIRDRIRSLIGDEDPKKPLSDAAIMKALKEEGVSVARRTVAKYREQLNILSSSQRKKVF